MVRSSRRKRGWCSHLATLNKSDQDWSKRYLLSTTRSKEADVVYVVNAKTLTKERSLCYKNQQTFGIKILAPVREPRSCE